MTCFMQMIQQQGHLLFVLILGHNIRNKKIVMRTAQPVFFLSRLMRACVGDAAHHHNNSE